MYKATDTRLGRTVAVKVLGSRFSKRFEGEARAIAALNHPHICTLYDVGPDYLVMEYVEGAPLQGPLPIEEALRLAIQIASALEVAHGKGIIHRDLKPANILVTKAGVKLLDFGLAKLTRSEDGDETRTIEGAVLGTAAYMSPEQAEGKPVDMRSDIFSFGAVLYEMVSGHRAFSGDSMASVLSAVLRDDPAPLQAPPALERIVTRCLLKKAAQRFQTMTEVKAALEQVSTRPAEQQPSIAVLPFTDMSPGKDNEYFSDGLAEEIINALTHVPGLKVSGRTSSFFFRGKDVEFAEIGKRLNVEHILEGSVRKAGNRIRVTAQLIEVSDGFHLWSERYDRDLVDVFAMQDEIAAAICAALQLKISRQPAAGGRHTPTLPAYEAYLKGIHYQFKTTPDSLARSQQYFEQAIALDPEFAMPYCGIGEVYFSLAYQGVRPAHEVMPLARAAVQKALNLDPSLPEAHALIGGVAAAYDYDWEEADHQFRLAMTSIPVPSAVHLHRAAWYLLPLGRAREATEETEQALEHDPLNVLYRAQLAFSLYAAEMPERAVAELGKVLEIDENYWLAHNLMGRNYLLSGMIVEALAAAERAYQLAPWNGGVIGLLAGTLVRTGAKKRAEGLVQQLMELPPHRISIGMAMYHLILSEADAAAGWIEKAIEQRAPWLVYNLRYPLLKPLRSSPHWPRLMRMMNLPETA